MQLYNSKILNRALLLITSIGSFLCILFVKNGEWNDQIETITDRYHFQPALIAVAIIALCFFCVFIYRNKYGPIYALLVYMIVMLEPIIVLFVIQGGFYFPNHSPELQKSFQLFLLSIFLGYNFFQLCIYNMIIQRKVYHKNNKKSEKNKYFIIATIVVTIVFIVVLALPMIRDIISDLIQHYNIITNSGAF